MLEAIWNSVTGWEGPEQRWYTEALGYQGTGEGPRTYGTSFESERKEMAGDRMQPKQTTNKTQKTITGSFLCRHGTHSMEQEKKK